MHLSPFPPSPAFLASFHYPSSLRPPSLLHYPPFYIHSPPLPLLSPPPLSPLPSHSLTLFTFKAFYTISQNTILKTLGMMAEEE
jgi:hypothetical protein